MTRDKQVSVRFAAVGGDSVKAEMRGLGLAGREAMHSIGQSASVADAGLEQISASALKARLNLEQMATKAAAEAAKMRTTIPAESDLQARVMRTTGVTRDDGLNTAAILQQGQALDDLRAKINPLYAEIRRYKQGVAEVRAAEIEGAISTEEAAVAKQRLRQASLQAIDGLKGISAANREAARAAEEAARASARQAQELSDLRARYNPVYAATRQYRAALADLNRLKQQGVIDSQEYSAALEREAERMRMNVAMSTAGLQQMAQASRGATLRMQQMFYQVNDVGVSLAGGMNPFVVLAQQGTQIAQIYGFGNGGVAGIFRDLGRMIGAVVGRYPLLTAAVVLGTAAIAGMTGEINEASSVTVSFGDTALAVFQVIGRGIYRWIEPAVSKIGDWFKTAWDAVVSGVRWVGNAIINGVKIAIDGIKTAVGTIPDVFSAAWNGAKATVFDALNDMLVGIESFLQQVTSGLNSTFGTSLTAPNLGGVYADLSKRATAADLAQGAARDRIAAAWDGFGQRSSETWNSDPMGDFYNAVKDQAIKNAQGRAKKKKSGGGGGSEADEVQDLVDSLTKELAVLREIDPVKKKMLEYADQLAGATEQERAQVEGLVVSRDRAKNGWEAVTRTVKEYAEDAKRIGDDIGDAITSAFGRGEDAIADFAKTGKLEVSDLVTSIIADMARIGTRRFVTGPISDGIGEILDGISFKGGSGSGSGSFFQRVIDSFEFGGRTGSGPRTGGLDGKGGFLAMLHPQERVVDEYRGQKAGGDRVYAPVVNFNVKDAESFRRGRSQMAADAQRLMMMGRRVN